MELILIAIIDGYFYIIITRMVHLQKKNRLLNDFIFSHFTIDWPESALIFASARNENLKQDREVKFRIIVQIIDFSNIVVLWNMFSTKH